MHRPEPEPEAAEDEAEQEADVETLYFGDIIAMEAREYVQRPHDSYAERVRKREFSKYMVNIKSYWTVSACGLNDGTATTLRIRYLSMNKPTALL